jgi:hypothetical protein
MGVARVILLRSLAVSGPDFTAADGTCQGRTVRMPCKGGTTVPSISRFPDFDFTPWVKRIATRVVILNDGHVTAIGGVELL